MSARPHDTALPAHLPALDGVRALSIIAVLVTHLLPVRFAGQSWNDSVGLFGMALFFVLSGYLITGQLLARPDWHVFLLRRLCRIVPVAWLCIAIVALVLPLHGEALWRNLLFVANLPPQQLVEPIEHFWSLGVEIQFYLLATALLLLRPGFAWWLLPALLFGVTALRIAEGVTASSVTWFRADDLLAGAVLALLVRTRHWPALAAGLGRPAVVWMLLLALCAASILPKSGSNALAYLRPYLAAAFVAALIARPGAALAQALGHRALRYIAHISYALYVWHMPLAATWLGSGELLEKYLKRPLLLVVLFIVAHVSTFHFERHFTDWAKRLGRVRPAPLHRA